MIRRSIFNLAFILVGLYTFAQKSVVETPNGWHHSDYKSDGLYGISIEKAYTQFLKEKKSKQTIIVAVIDSGIDTTHEDLKSILWTNKREVPGNHIDDDKNGYVDDIHGWNFLGNSNGQNVNKDSYEAARIYYRLKKKYGDISSLPENSSNDQISEFNIYKRAKDQIESQGKEASMIVMILKTIMDKLPEADSVIRTTWNKQIFTGEELMSFKPSSVGENKAKNMMLGLFQQTQQMDITNKQMIEELTNYYNAEKSKVDNMEKEPEDYRNSIIKDNYNDINDRFYGNNDIMGPNSMHGTHVSGIIGAIRNNGKGVNGIADNVRIMTIRAVPDGDEHDKDIALAIKYAVDNGAKVINMSFGKSFSPQKKWVDDAVKYAESKGVLLVHAAGNESMDLDQSENYPTPQLLETRKASNWITVGASGPTQEDLVASFSNYGKNNVDVFSPGLKIYSTLPGGNVYGNEQGTSMASPVVAGLAALILSYYPELTVTQVKEVIEKTVTPIKGMMVNKPNKEGKEEKIDFSDLSKSSGIINAFDALMEADKLSKEMKNIQTPLPKSSIKKTNKG